MKIEKIRLRNFGSYEGENRIDLSDTDPSKRVVVIGGKNGAGKTTLFTAIQVCLYGHHAFGYRTAGHHYLKEIYNLINSKVRMDETQRTFAEIEFQQIDNADLVNYIVHREWRWPDNNLQERLFVFKNGSPLSQEELANFQNYLLHLIPPEMLKLYFFDGEKIADYFLSSKEINIRDALMVLSGNDTFDILYENVKRVLKISENTQGTAAQTYLDAKNSVDKLQNSIALISENILQNEAAIKELAHEIDQYKSDYAKRGGVTLDMWSKLHEDIKVEEERREHLNSSRKVIATEILPFIIAKEMVNRVIPQIQSENSFFANNTLKQSLESQVFLDMLHSEVIQMGSNNPIVDAQSLLNRIQNCLLDSKWDGFSPIFGLSGDEESLVRTLLARISQFEPDTFKTHQAQINESLEKTKKLRATLQASDLENFEEYIKTVTSLEEQQKLIRVKIDFANSELEEKQQELQLLESKFKSAKKAFEEQLKVQSVSSVSGKVLLLLEELQSIIYGKMLHNVQRDLNRKFAELIRKNDFFTEIRIDNDFSVHILRDEAIVISDLISHLKKGGFNQIKTALGSHALKYLQDVFPAQTAAELKSNLEYIKGKELILPVEVDKNRLSSGEKQIFVMSLYWALMNQSKNILPFIIDTPFARIDAEHRSNITEHFFKALSGQLIVLSTDEEISGTHLSKMEDQISRIYMLEYGEDKATHIYQNQYFEV